MTEPRSLVVRLLDSPDIARVVPRLAPEVLHRLIDRCGLEACADVIALATPRQLQRLLDIDLWRAVVPGRDEELDAGRFGEWLEVLLELGAAAAAERLAAMDFDLVVGGLAAHIRVFDGATVSGFTTLDGEHVSARTAGDRPTAGIGGFVAESRGSAVFATVVELLTGLHAERPTLFGDLLRACVALSDGPRERDGLDEVSRDRDRQLASLAIDRQVRRDREGFVSPAEARAFLRAARDIRLDGARPAANPTARAYLRDLVPDPTPDDETVPDHPLESEAPLTRVMEILADAGVVAPPRALLPAAAGDGPAETVAAFVASHASAQGELAFLANVALAGCAIHDRTLTPPEAADFVAATCTLGLENWPPTWQSADLLTAFQIGWALLHRDLCCHAAQVLAVVLGDLECADRDVQWSLQALRRELLRQLARGEPWRARPALDALLALDGAAWAVLRGFIDECPTLHPAVHGGGRHIDPAAFAFVSANTQIAAGRVYLASLGPRLYMP